MDDVLRHRLDRRLFGRSAAAPPSPSGATPPAWWEDGSAGVAGSGLAFGATAGSGAVALRRLRAGGGGHGMLGGSGARALFTGAAALASAAEPGTAGRFAGGSLAGGTAFGLAAAACVWAASAAAGVASAAGAASVVGTAGAAATAVGASGSRAGLVDVGDELSTPSSTYVSGSMAPAGSSETTAHRIYPALAIWARCMHSLNTIPQ